MWTRKQKRMNKQTMKYSSKHFINGNEAETVVVGEGVIRKNLGFDDSLFVARVSFEADSIGYTHSHPHSQVAYVESGVFDFTVGTETRRLEAGDCAYIPPGTEHGATCVEAGVLIDCFSPVREDFLDDEK